jgi:hypothetical protein
VHDGPPTAEAPPLRIGDKPWDFEGLGDKLWDVRTSRGPPGAVAAPSAARAGLARSFAGYTARAIGIGGDRQRPALV